MEEACAAKGLVRPEVKPVPPVREKGDCKPENKPDPATAIGATDAIEPDSANEGTSSPKSPSNELPEDDLFPPKMPPNMEPSITWPPPADFIPFSVSSHCARISENKCFSSPNTAWRRLPEVMSSKMLPIWLASSSRVCWKFFMRSAFSCSKAAP